MLQFKQNGTGGIFSLSPCLFPGHRVWSSSIWPPLWSQMPASVLILIRIDSLHARFLSQHPLKLCCQGSQIQQWCRKIGEPIYLSISCLLLTIVLLRRPAAAWWEVIGWWAGWISRPPCQYARWTSLPCIGGALVPCQYGHWSGSLSPCDTTTPLTTWKLYHGSFLILHTSEYPWYHCIAFIFSVKTCLPQS